MSDETPGERPSPPVSSDEGRGAKSLYALLALCAVPLLALGSMGFARRWIADDGMINVRIIRMILGGHGPVFNVGERVEAHTSTLWVVVCAGVGALGVRVEDAAVYAGLLLSVCGLGLAMSACVWLHGETWKTLHKGAMWPLGALVYAALPPAWDYATSGLETGLTLGWLGLSYCLLVRWAVATSPSRLAWRAGVAILSLGPLIRPELSLFSLLAGGAMALGIARTFGKARASMARGVAEVVLLLGSIPVGYQLFRMGYYAALTPNTALAKEAFESNWEQGWHFFGNFFGLYHVWLPAALLALMALGLAWRSAWRGERWRALCVALPLGLGVFYTLYVVKVGGGFMHGRLFLPAVFCALLPAMMMPVRAHADAARAHKLVRPLAALAVVVWCVWCAFGVRVERANEHGIGDERGWYSRQAKNPTPTHVEDYKPSGFYKDASALKRDAARRCKPGELDRLTCRGEPFVRLDWRRKLGSLKDVPREVPAKPGRLPEGVGYVVHRTAIGIRGVLLGPGVHVVDHVGLADPIASRLVLKRRGRPGHEKRMMNVWVAARFAKPLPEEPQSLRIAREVLECAPLVQLDRALTQPMSWERFWTNVRLARAFHALRIDPNPSRARQELCETP